MKKFLSLVLALVMALSLTTVAWGEACADPDACTHEAAIGTEHYATLTLAISAATSGQTVTMLKDVTVTGTLVVNGITLDGGNHKLIADAALGGMDDVGDDTKTVVKSTVGCTLQNLTIEGGKKGVLIGSAATQDVVLDNVTIVKSARAFNITESSAGVADVDLTVKNSTLAGWCGFSTTGTVVFENTKFVTNASDRGNGLNPRGDMTLTNCTVNDGFELTTEDLATDEAIAINGGTYNGDLVKNGAGTFVITAGTFADDVSDYVASDKALVSDGAGGYVVVEESANSWNTLYGKKTTVAGATISAVTLEYYKAVAPVYDDDGVVTNQPSIAYYLCPELTGTTYLVEVTSLGAADVVVYNDVNGKVVFKYLDIVYNVEYEGNAIPFTNFGKACGQYKDANYDKTAKYYTFENVVYKAVETSGTALMVNGKLVPVDPATGAFVQHIASYTYNDKFEVTAVKCGVCGKPATIVPNYASLPDDVTSYGPINEKMYYYWPAAVVAPSTDKVVESAETFDAGIAMYVGMSVLAATGSAVVLKKRER